VTEAAQRGRGLASARAGALCEDILARGHIPTWTTSPDNAASLRVAERLGFRPVRDDVLRVIGRPIPRAPAPPPSSTQRASRRR
jgi:RimJ/RimL family protein N-acetyltransferase